MMSSVSEDEIEQEKLAWKEKYAKDYERFSRNIAELESARTDWSSQAAFNELRNHLHAINKLHEKLFTLLATLGTTQKRLALTEAELQQLRQEGQTSRS